MNIRLARPPTARSTPWFADDVASWVRARFEVDLDYSVESLEVFVRHANAEWTDREQLPPVVACGETRINPIGKVVKRVALGDRGDLATFYARFAPS